LTNKKCPKCGKPLLIKVNKRTGSSYLACPGYPKCCYTESVIDHNDKLKSGGYQIQLNVNLLSERKEKIDA
jgi:ssDNA-binding Zn-finger/Zn-ribbon topoisomerase 1